MDFKVEKFEDYTLFKILERKLDRNIAGNLKAELVLVNGKGEKNIILDLSGCDYCDSAGLSMILAAKRLCTNSNGCFVLFGVCNSVEQLFSNSQLNSVLTIFNSLKNAINTIRFRSNNINKSL
jgi:anti-sigma B factor antagonist